MWIEKYATGSELKSSCEWDLGYVGWVGGGGGGGGLHTLWVRTGLGTQISNRTTGSVSNGGPLGTLDIAYSLPNGFVNSRKIWYWYYMLVL